MGGKKLIGLHSVQVGAIVTV